MARKAELSWKPVYNSINLEQTWLTFLSSCLYHIEETHEVLDVSPCYVNESNIIGGGWVMAMVLGKLPVPGRPQYG